MPRVLAQALLGARVCCTMEITAFQRSVRSSAVDVARLRPAHVEDVSLARVTLLICTVTDSLPMRATGRSRGRSR